MATLGSEAWVFTLGRYVVFIDGGGEEILTGGDEDGGRLVLVFRVGVISESALVF